MNIMTNMNRLITDIYLAAENDFIYDGKVGSKDFWATTMGSTLRTLMGIVGIFVVVYAILKAVKNIATGKVADSVKGIVGAILLAAILFNPPMIQSAIKAGGNIVNSVINTVSEVGGGSPSNSTPASGDQPADSRSGG